MRAFFVSALVLLSAHNTISSNFQNHCTISKISNKNLIKIKNREKSISFVKVNH